MTLSFDSSLWTEDDFAYLTEHGDRFVISQNIPGLLEITAHGYDIGDALDDFLGDVLDLDDQYVTLEQDGETQIFQFSDLSPDIQNRVVTEIEKLKNA